MSNLQGKTIVLGLSGGIACYKAAELVRTLVKAEANVHVVMTQAAREFVTPLTLQALSGHPVATDLFDLGQESQIGHIRLADSADVLLIAPATANVIAKVAHGIADDLLTTVALATRAPVVLAPAMNVNMLENRITQENLRRLAELGMRIVPPDVGFLACGWEGAGRLAADTSIVAAVGGALAPQDLTGEHVLVTAGPTREPIDPVRYLSNRSSGRMGYAIAAAARRRGAEVILVSGPTALEAPQGVRRIAVTTAAEMRSAVLTHEPWSTVLVMAAAVADYRAARPAAQKIKKKMATLSLELEPTEDILREVGRRSRPERMLVGFAAETENALTHARTKLREKKLDLLVVNDVSQADAGFDVETNRVWLIAAGGTVDEWPLMAKDAVADRLMTEIAASGAARAKHGPSGVASRVRGRA